MQNNPLLTAAITDGPQAIRTNAAYLDHMVSIIEHQLSLGRLDAAAAYISIAARHAWSGHSGIFASARLERIISHIGRIISDRSTSVCRHPNVRSERILHVATEVQEVGGLTRMMRRWVDTDSRRSHSLVLTRQGVRQIPAFLTDAFAARGGSIHMIDGIPGGILHRAKILRKIALEYDIVVLHIAAGDVVALLAMASLRGGPRIIYLNHADHGFWLGVSVSHVVANIRVSGEQLSLLRRGVDPDRSMILPILLDEAPSSAVSRNEARIRLGLQSNEIVILSAARGMKYLLNDLVNFPEAHLPVLQKHRNAILIVVGAGHQPSWSRAISDVNGRIRTFDQQGDVSLFFRAADIYVDSFPFVSLTSLLEAGQYGLPLVTRFPYSEESRILGSDLPELTDHLIVARNDVEYNEILSKLIVDESSRSEIGKKVKDNINQVHIGDRWMDALEAIYHKAHQVSRNSSIITESDSITTTELDCLRQTIFCGRYDINVEKWIQCEDELGVMPLVDRFQVWLSLYRRRAFRNIGRYGVLAALIPEWIRCRVGRARRSLQGVLGFGLNPRRSAVIAAMATASRKVLASLS